MALPEKFKFRLSLISLMSEFGIISESASSLEHGAELIGNQFFIKWHEDWRADWRKVFVSTVEDWVESGKWIIIEPKTIVVEHWTCSNTYTLEPVEGGYEVFRDGRSLGVYVDKLVTKLINDGYWIVKEN